MSLSADYLARVIRCFYNDGLIRDGKREMVWDDGIHVGWCSTITLGKVRIDSWTSAAAAPFTEISNVYIRRPVFWLFWKWVPVSGDGPWWAVIRDAIPRLEAEIARTVIETGSNAGAVSLISEDVPAPLINKK